MQIAVDAMGGDHAPGVVVEGAARAVRHLDGVQVTLFGPEAEVRAALADAGLAEAVAAGDLAVADAPDVIGMAEAPAAAVKRKRHSSIHRGLAACNTGAAHAFVSAGNTGAVMAASMFVLGRVAGVERPALCGFFPTVEGRALVVDIGTNVDCKPEHLAQFARMASVYAQRVLGLEAPSVGLVNIGEEPGKGNEQVKATYELLEAEPTVHFAGNVEGGDLLHHPADILLFDGFVGNILLKFGESMTTVLREMTQREMERQGLTPDERRLVAGVLGEVRKGFDAEEGGGAPLLGVAGHVLIGHGGSSAQAIAQLIAAAVRVARQDVAGALADAFAG
jgi:glycerol-3-phosphate acyltransferase PlsX